MSMAPSTAAARRTNACVEGLARWGEDRSGQKKRKGSRGRPSGAPVFPETQTMLVKECMHTSWHANEISRCLYCIWYPCYNCTRPFSSVSFRFCTPERWNSDRYSLLRRGLPDGPGAVDSTQLLRGWGSCLWWMQSRAPAKRLPPVKDKRPGYLLQHASERRGYALVLLGESCRGFLRVGEPRCEAPN